MGVGDRRENELTEIKANWASQQSHGLAELGKNVTDSCLKLSKTLV